MKVGFGARVAGRPTKPGKRCKPVLPMGPCAPEAPCRIPVRRGNRIPIDPELPCARYCPGDLAGLWMPCSTYQKLDKIGFGFPVLPAANQTW